MEYQSFRRLGGTEEIKVDVRIISATNKVLHDAIRSGDFREDLFYRLNVIEFYIPPLRHRREDIPLLTDYFLKLFSEKYDVNEIFIEEDCVECLKKYNWPGNVRELKNMVERVVVLSKDGVIKKEILPSNIKCSKDIYEKDSQSSLNEADKSSNLIKIKIGTSLEEIEKKVIKRTLDSVNNNKSEAADILGFSRKTLHNKLQKYNNERTLKTA